MKSKTSTLEINKFKGFISQNKRELSVFFCAFIVLIANHYLSETENLIYILSKLDLKSIENIAQSAFVTSENSRFNSLVYWVLVLNFSYLIIPILFIKFYLKKKTSEFGLSFSVEKNFAKYYPIFMLFMLILVFFASKTSAFQEKYPFYKIYDTSQLYPKFLIWELLYCSQFFCLEFFFRGFMVKGLQNKFGIWAIFVMTIPYCMIHFGKPLPETIGSVFAGIILGYISYSGKGVLAGFLMHITVALSMDFMALWQTGVI